MAAGSLDEVPVVDLATMSAAEAAAVVDAALRRYGFFYVAGHGIPEELIAQQCAPCSQRVA
jgi:isopenicillin N synthase-like dioxygenase